MSDKENEGISIRYLMQAPEWLKDSWGYSGADTDGRMFDELKKGTLPEGLANAVIDELRTLAEGSIKHSRKSRDSGSKSKRRDWADAIALHLREQQPNATKESLWLLIPDSHSPIQVTVAGQRWEISKDGDKITAIKDYDGTSQDLTKRVFFDTYLKKKPE